MHIQITYLPHINKFKYFFLLFFKNINKNKGEKLALHTPPIKTQPLAIPLRSSHALLRSHPLPLRVGDMTYPTSSMWAELKAGQSDYSTDK